MDIDLRFGLIVVGIIIILVVLIDGYRRMHLARKRTSELNFGLEKVKGNEDHFSSELPNGGARRSRFQNDMSGRSEERLEPDISSMEYSVAGHTHSSSSSDLESDYQREDSELRFIQDEEVISARSDEVGRPSVSEESVQKPLEEVQSMLDLDDPLPVLTELESHSSIEDVTNSSYPEKNIEQPVIDSMELNSDMDDTAVPGQSVEKLSDRAPTSEVIVINVLARGDTAFDGARLLQCLLASNMRFGDMAVFHRFSNVNGSGKILFSMANGIEPGTFQIDKLETTETTAVSFFLGLPGPERPMQAFTLMEETARQLALDLGGELKDEQFSVMTQQTLEHCRQRILEYERKQLAHKVTS